METTRSWLRRLQQREGKVKPVFSKKKEMESTNDSIDEAPVSEMTKKRVAAAKQFIENHYKNQMKSLQDRKERLVVASKLVRVCKICGVPKYGFSSSGNGGYVKFKRIHIEFDEF